MFIGGQYRGWPLKLATNGPPQRTTTGTLSGGELMHTLELNLDVDQLTDYNELGAAPTGGRYSLYIMADVTATEADYQVSNVDILDPVQNNTVNFDSLSDRDRHTIVEAVKARALEQEAEFYDSH